MSEPRGITRNETILLERERGKRATALAREYGLSSGRIIQICRRQLEIRELVAGRQALQENTDRYLARNERDRPKGMFEVHEGRVFRVLTETLETQKTEPGVFR